MMDIITKYLEGMYANRVKTGEMALRYEGAIEVLEQIQAELKATAETPTPEASNGPGNSAQPSASAPAAPARKRASKRPAAL
jgi:hypothetical protein